MVSEATKNTNEFTHHDRTMEKKADPPTTTTIANNKCI